MTGFMRSLWTRNGSGPAPRRPSDCPAPPTEAETAGGGEELLWSEDNFALEGLRLLVFRDASEWSERRLLYDSATVRLRPPSESSGVSEGEASPTTSSPRRPPKCPAPRTAQSADLRFEFAGKMADTKMLGEMVFGSMPMSFKGETLKLHKYKGNGDMVLSKVFAARRRASLANSSLPPSISETGTLMDYSSDSDSQYSTVNSLTGLFPGGPGSRSIPMDVPERLFKTPTSSAGSRGNWSPETSRMSPDVAPGPCRSASATAALAADAGDSFNLCGSPISRSLRLRTAQAYSLDYGISRLRSHCSESETAAPTKGHGRTQLGICLVLPGPRESSAAEASWRHFILTHVQLLDAELLRLQGALVTAHAIKSAFYSLLYRAWTQLRARLAQLYNASRLREPVWLSLRRYAEAGSAKAAEDLSARFLATFVRLARLADTKEHRFFLSNLVTSVLMEHGTWVGSVGPTSSTQPFLRRLAARTRFCHAADVSPPPSPVPTPEITIEGVSRQGSADLSGGSSPHLPLPYNPLLAQYSEVRGRVGEGGSGEARVLVTGADAALVNDFLFLLSYFVRCSDVRPTAAGPADLPPTPQLATQLFTVQTTPSVPLFTPTPVAPVDTHACAPAQCCAFNIDADSLRLDSSPKPEKATSPLEAIFKAPDRKPIVERRKKPSVQRVLGRPRSDSMLGVRRSIDEPPEPRTAAPAVIQISNRRFEVTRVPDSAVSLPTAHSADHMSLPGRHFRRPGSPKKRTQLRRSPVCVESPAVAAPPVWHERISLSEPLDLEKNPKLRKVSAGHLCVAPHDTPVTTACQLSPVCGVLPLSDLDSGGCSSGAEELPSASDAERKKTPPGPPRSLDSGIAEADAMNLMESSGLAQPPPPPSEPEGLGGEQLASLQTHKVVFGDRVELEEFAPLTATTTKADTDHIDGRPTTDFGQSLLAGFLPTYSPHFALSGCPHRPDLIPTILDEMSQRTSDVIGDSVCVVGNTLDWSVRLVSARSGIREAVVPSPTVLRLVESVCALAELDATDDFLLGTLEEGLAEIWAKSLSLAGAVEGGATVRRDGQGELVEMTEIVRLAELDWADLPLLFAVAGLHSHRLLNSLSL